MALWELSTNPSKVPDTAMTTAEIIPCEWPVAPESRLRSSTGLGSQISDVTNHQILNQEMRQELR